MISSEATYDHPCRQRQKLQLTQGGRLTEDPEQQLVLGLLTFASSCNVRAPRHRGGGGFTGLSAELKPLKEKG